MKATTRKGWRQILKMAVEGALICGFLMFLLFHTHLGDKYPEALKLWGPIGIWLVTMAFLIAHMTRDGRVEYKIW